MCVYAPYPGLSTEEKDRFYEQLLVLANSVVPSETLVMAGDFNSHASQDSQGLSWHHGGCGYGRNENTRSLCCYLFSFDKYILRKEKFASS